MRLFIGLVICFLISFQSHAQQASVAADDRLTELIQKKIDLQNKGQDLSSKDSDELAKLTAQKGIIGTAEIQKQIEDMNASKQAAAQAAPSLVIPSPVLMTPPPASLSVTPAQQIAQQQAVQASPQNQPVNTALPQETQSSSLPIKKKALVPVGSTDLGEERDLGAESVLANQPPTPVKKAKKREIAEPVDTEFQKRLKKDSEKTEEVRKQYKEINQVMAVEEAKKPATVASAKSSGEIYTPIPDELKIKNNNFNIERGSQSVIHMDLGTDDVPEIKMCIAYGVSIILEDRDELQRVIKDDNIFFDAQQFDNKKGVYVRLTKPIPDGSRWDSAIRLVRKSDDKTFLIKLRGVSCPEGDVNFPKIVYIKEKQDFFSHKQDLLAPEDFLIQVSKGFQRDDQKNTINMYDMIGAADSDLKLISIEVTDAKIAKPDEAVEFILLDNLEINKWKTKQEFLKLQSDKATQLRVDKLLKQGIPKDEAISHSVTYRYKILTAIKKEYIFKQRFMWLVYINNESKHYQMLKVDLMNYYQSLRDRGFDL